MEKDKSYKLLQTADKTTDIEEVLVDDNTDRAEFLAHDFDLVLEGTDKKDIFAYLQNISPELLTTLKTNKVAKGILQMLTQDVFPFDIGFARPRVASGLQQMNDMNQLSDRDFEGKFLDSDTYLCELVSSLRGQALLLRQHLGDEPLEFLRRRALVVLAKDFQFHNHKIPAKLLFQLSVQDRKKLQLELDYTLREAFQAKIAEALSEYYNNQSTFQEKQAVAFCEKTANLQLFLEELLAAKEGKLPL